MSADKLASFRVDGQLWEQFQGYAKENNVTATALLISYIKSVINTGNVITSSQNINTSSDTNNPSLSIQDIDKRIDEKIKLSIQNIDSINTLSIQDIDNRIAESLADGGIGEAIAKSYTAAMGQFNGLLEELQELKKQFEELKSIPPAPVPQSPITNEELTIDNEELTTDNGELLIVNYQLPDDDSNLTDSDLKPDTQSTITDEEQAERNRQSHEEYVQTYLTPKPEKQRLDPAIYTRNYQIVSMLDCQFWMDGKRFNNEELISNKIGENIKNNKTEIESMLDIEINTKQSVIQRFRSILKAMGFDVILDGKGCYKISNPEIFN
ncbi:hypothetical protein [Dolichospermum sp. LEGE 00246]|uniref:hypothetical protein n=1 Tax=Dolichospermum sp. LEGE 00246 TaxID=1828605 RepID=UPI0018818B11|nr:hypothetical protein [Dolichospermum sp. LEGE 00246]